MLRNIGLACLLAVGILCACGDRPNGQCCKHDYQCESGFCGCGDFCDAGACQPKGAPCQRDFDVSCEPCD